MGFSGANYQFASQPNLNSNQYAGGQGGNFSQNLNNIYQNLSNYQSMIDQIERGSLPSYNVPSASTQQMKAGYGGQYNPASDYTG